MFVIIVILELLIKHRLQCISIIADHYSIAIFNNSIFCVFFLLKNVNNPFKEFGLTCDLSQAPSCPTPAPISPIVGFPPFSKYSLKGLLTKFQVTSCMPDSQGLEMGAFVIFHFVRSSFVYDPFRFNQLFKKIIRFQNYY